MKLRIEKTKHNTIKLTYRNHKGEVIFDREITIGELDQVTGLLRLARNADVFQMDVDV